MPPHDSSEIDVQLLSYLYPILPITKRHLVYNLPNLAIKKYFKRVMKKHMNILDHCNYLSRFLFILHTRMALKSIFECKIFACDIDHIQIAFFGKSESKPFFR